MIQCFIIAISNGYRIQPNNDPVAFCVKPLVGRDYVPAEHEYIGAQNIGKISVLVDLAESLGVPPLEAEKVL